MAINGDYAQPVYVNGYRCQNCAQVAEAKQGVDPAHPKSGPYGVDAKSDPTQTQAVNQSPAVIFGGQLAAKAPIAASSSLQSSPSPTIGGQLDLSV